MALERELGWVTCGFFTGLGKGINVNSVKTSPIWCGVVGLFNVLYLFDVEDNVYSLTSIVRKSKQ